MEVKMAVAGGVVILRYMVGNRVSVKGGGRRSQVDENGGVVTALPTDDGGGAWEGRVCWR